MATEKGLAIVAVGLTSFMTLGCTVSKNFNEHGHPMPNGWSAAVSNFQGQCSGLDGTYLNLGLGRQALEDELIQVRLDVALGHASPTQEMPSEVSIRFDAEHDVLNYDFHGTVDESYSTSARCSDGWYTWTRTITDKYVGDGANLDYSIREIKVANASDGDLIVHLALDTQFSSFGILKSQYKRETWSKFQAIKPPD